MEKHIIGENRIGYTLREDGLYYPDLELPEGTHYEIGKYGRMRREYLKNHRRGEYIRLLMDGKLNEYLHEVDEECYERMELLVEQMKVGTGITEELKASDQIKWVGLMNNVRSAAEETVIRELISVMFRIFYAKRTNVLTDTLKMRCFYSIIKTVIRKAGEIMLEKIIELTNKYIESMPKKERKKYGQFFTSMETARFMAGLYNIPADMKKVRILDAGAGSGILSCAFIERLEKIDNVQEIEVTCYENDSNVLNLLENNLEYCRANANKKITLKIITDNYILSQYLDFNHMIGGNSNPKKYDYVIGNPPYMKISKDAPETTAMPEVCYGAPNLYFLFASMGLFNLQDNGEMVYIIPRSWTSGAYFKRFREYFLTEGRLEHIHLFVSRNKVFDKEDVLQETIIVKVKKTKITPNAVTITSSNSNKDFGNITSLTVPYSLVVSGKDFYVYLVTNETEVEVLERLQGFDKTLPDIGVKMKTGLTVDFRNRDILRDTEEEGAIPLFYSQHIKQGKVQFPINKENEYVVTNKQGLMQDNKNYLFVKRFTAKEEHRRLQCGVYLAKDFPQYKKISTQNKINFIDGVMTELSECLVYGLYVLFNSTLYDEYYRILNGSTQVNSTEINSMPVPELKCIQEMGRKLMKSRDYSEENCNLILEGYCG